MWWMMSDIIRPGVADRWCQSWMGWCHPSPRRRPPPPSALRWLAHTRSPAPCPGHTHTHTGLCWVQGSRARRTHRCVSECTYLVEVQVAGQQCDLPLRSDREQRWTLDLLHAGTRRGAPAHIRALVPLFLGPHTQRFNHTTRNRDAVRHSLKSLGTISIEAGSDFWAASAANLAAQLHRG